MSYNIVNQKKPERISSSLVSRLILLADNFSYKFSFILVLILYISLVACTILLFAVIYEQYDKLYLYDMERGLWILKSAKKAVGWDHLYFSTVTFFSSAYGDIVPLDDTTKFISQIEMFLGYILNVLYIPILFGFLVVTFNRIFRDN